MKDDDDLSFGQLEQFLIGTAADEPYSLDRLASRAALTSDLVGMLSEALFDDCYDVLLCQFIDALVDYGTLMCQMAADMRVEDHETVIEIEQFLERQRQPPPDGPNSSSNAPGAR